MIGAEIFDRRENRSFAIVAQIIRFMLLDHLAELVAYAVQFLLTHERQVRRLNDPHDTIGNRFTKVADLDRFAGLVRRHVRQRQDKLRQVVDL